MANREKVINELNDCLENQHILFMEGVGDIYAVSEETIKNIITLLKEQKEKPVIYDKQPCNSYPDAHCPKCRIAISRFIHYPSEIRPKYCPICGQAVKWNN